MSTKTSQSMQFALDDPLKIYLKDMKSAGNSTSPGNAYARWKARPSTN